MLFVGSVFVAVFVLAGAGARELIRARNSTRNAYRLHIAGE